MKPFFLAALTAAALMTLPATAAQMNRSDQPMDLSGSHDVVADDRGASNMPDLTFDAPGNTDGGVGIAALSTLMFFGMVALWSANRRRETAAYSLS